MKPLKQKYYRVKHDFKVGSFSLAPNEHLKTEYWVDVGRDWLTVNETKKLVRQLNANLRRIAAHKERY